MLSSRQELRKRIVREPVKVKPVEPGRIPRVSRLMALALQFEQLLQNGEATDQSSLARTMQITQPRASRMPLRPQASTTMTAKLLNSRFGSCNPSLMAKLESGSKKYLTL